MDATARERTDSALDPALERGHDPASTRLPVADTGEQ